MLSTENFETKSSSVFSTKHAYSVAVGREPEATSRQGIQVMVKLADICACVRRPHPDLQARVAPETLTKFRDAMEPFKVYLQNQYDLALEDPEDVDMLLMDFRTEFELTRSKQVLLVAAVEFFLSHLRKRYGGAPVQNTYVTLFHFPKNVLTYWQHCAHLKATLPAWSGDTAAAVLRFETQ